MTKLKYIFVIFYITTSYSQSVKHRRFMVDIVKKNNFSERDFLRLDKQLFTTHLIREIRSTFLNKEGKVEGYEENIDLLLNSKNQYKRCLGYLLILGTKDSIRERRLFEFIERETKYPLKPSVYIIDCITKFKHNNKIKLFDYIFKFEVNITEELNFYNNLYNNFDIKILKKITNPKTINTYDLKKKLIALHILYTIMDTDKFFANNTDIIKEKLVFNKSEKIKIKQLLIKDLKGSKNQQLNTIILRILYNIFDFDTIQNNLEPFYKGKYLHPQYIHMLSLSHNEKDVNLAIENFKKIIYDKNFNDKTDSYKKYIFNLLLESYDTKIYKLWFQLLIDVKIPEDYVPIKYYELLEKKDFKEDIESILLIKKECLNLSKKYLKVVKTNIQINTHPKPKKYFKLKGKVINTTQTPDYGIMTYYGVVEFEIINYTDKNYELDTIPVVFVDIGSHTKYFVKNKIIELTVTEEDGYNNYDVTNDEVLYGYPFDKTFLGTHYKVSK